MGTVIGSKTVNTYVFFYVGAKRSLKNAEKQSTGYAYDLLSALVMSSFLVEAYLNHIGEKLGFSEWNNKKDRTSVWKKYILLREKLGMSKMKLEDAYPSASKAIEFRNSMAHGRTETHIVSMDLDDELLGQHDQPVGWQQALDPLHVSSCFRGCEDLIRELHDKAGLGKHPFFTMSSGSTRESLHWPLSVAEQDDPIAK